MGKVLDLTPLSEAITGVSNTILDYALLLAAVGTTAMALWEVAKSLSLFRTHYNQLMFRKWIGSADENIQDDFFRLAAGEKTKSGYKVWHPIFDQPAEKLMGQIQAAANVALDYPQKYTHFYEFLTANEDPNDTDRDLWRAHAGQAATRQQPGQQPSVDAAEARKATEARARIGNFVARKLDAFQNKLEYWWARANQGAAITIGAVIFWYAIHQTQDVSKVDPFTLIVAAVLAGLVSPFAKDVVSALSGLRAKRG